MATIEVPNRYLALSPVVVTSPTTRCGTTLIQRLLSDSDNALIYGEEIGNQLRTLTLLLVDQLSRYDLGADEADEAFRTALAESLRDWRPGFSPPSEVMLRIWIETFYQLPWGLADFGRSIGRPLWGFKWPGYGAEHVQALLKLMPQSRIVYVVRDVFDALRSAKARRFVRTAEDASAFCSAWTHNILGLGDMFADPRILLIRYETLVARPDEMLNLLESFTGIENIRRRSLDLRFNTFVGEEDHGHSASQYIPPATLTAEEHDIASRCSGDLMRQLYPERGGPEAQSHTVQPTR